MGALAPEPHAECLARLAHDHAWGHENTHAAEARTRTVIALTAVTMVGEIAAGLASGSLALLADGLHMGSHVAALSITAWAYAYARRHAHDTSFSFGTGKVGSLAAFASALLLGVFALGMAVEAVQRLLRPEAVAWNVALAVAALGLAVNLASAALLHEHHGHDDHNLRSARLHVLADALTSVLALLALGAGRGFGWTWPDAAAGIVGAVVIVRWSIGLVGQSAGVLLDRSAPAAVCALIRAAVERGSGDRVADLHVWRVAPDGFAAVITIVSDTPRTPDAYRALLPAELTLHHVNVEIHPCQHGIETPAAPTVATLRAEGLHG